MRPTKASFVALCQQLLALGVVLAVVAPASSVVTLDVIRSAPRTSGEQGGETGGEQGGASGGQPSRSAPSESGAPATGPSASPAAEASSPVADEPVTPEVTERPMTAEQARDDGIRGARGGSLEPGTPGDEAGRETVASAPTPVEDHATVGVTWHGVEQLADDDIAVELRSRESGGSWTTWEPVEYHSKHRPDPDSAEGADVRPGTEPILVDDADEVQVRATARGEAPSDIRVAVVDPGTDGSPAPQEPEIDTSQRSDRSSSPEASASPAGAADAGAGTGEDGLALRAGEFTPEPQIYSRAQWGADESMRDPGSLSYHEVHAGFVHHTVNANDYSRSQVPRIIRGIYAYHTQSRGWSDIGYNFLVDRFGRIWEGRYGGVDRPVVGAHTRGYNADSFAMSAIGNFQEARPDSAIVTAFGRLMAWKLSLHGVELPSRQWVGGDRLPAINGHRDVGSTACPGIHLYRQLDTIRTLARQHQRPFSGRDKESDLVGSPAPDLVLRRKRDGRGFVLPTGGVSAYGVPRSEGRTGWGRMDTVVGTPDVTGDGTPDVLARRESTQVARVFPGDGEGGFGRWVSGTRGFRDLASITAVGDLDRDGRNDLLGLDTAAGELVAFFGRGEGRFDRRVLDTGYGNIQRLASSGDMTGDGNPDWLVRTRADNLFLVRGTGTREAGSVRHVPGPWEDFPDVTGFGDYNKDGKNDLFARKQDGTGYVFPGRGNGTVARARGPSRRVRQMDDVSSGGSHVGNGAPDLLGVVDDELMVVENSGRYETRDPVDTGLDLSGYDWVANAGDWDRDGDGDLIARDQQGVLYLHRGNGKGDFAEADRIRDGMADVAKLTAVGDITGDGWPDLLGQPERSGAPVRIFPGAGTDTMPDSYRAHSRIPAQMFSGMGRWNGDGAPDVLVREEDRFRLFPSNGPGGLTDPAEVRGTVAGYDRVVGTEDVRLGSRPSLFVRQASTGFLYLRRQRGDGLTRPYFMGARLEQFDLIR